MLGDIFFLRSVDNDCMQVRIIQVRCLCWKDSWSTQCTALESNWFSLIVWMSSGFIVSPVTIFNVLRFHRRGLFGHRLSRYSPFWTKVQLAVLDIESVRIMILVVGPRSLWYRATHFIVETAFVSWAYEFYPWGVRPQWNGWKLAIL